MYLWTLGKFIYQGVDTVSGPFHPFGGAVDIVVVQQQDGTFKTSPWYVRFGKFQGLLKSREKIVNINVNGSDSDFHMFLDSKGEAFFLHSTIVDVEDPATSSPGSSGNEREDKDKTEESENSDLNEGGTVKREDKNKTEGNENCDLNEGQSIKRTGSKRSILGFMFGGSSKNNNKGSDIERRSSFEKAEIAADLLDMKWSTNLSLSDRREVQLDLSNLEGQDANLASNGIVERGVELDSINLRCPDENSQSNGIAEEISTREVELDSMNLRGHDENSPSNEELVEKVSARGVELDSMNLSGQDENLVDNILRGESENSDENVLEKVVKVKSQSTEINNSEIELNEKSYNITENKTTSEVSIVKNCLEKTNKIEEKVTNSPDIDFDSSEINKEKMLDNSEKNEIDFEEKELNLIPRLVSSNSDNSDLNLPNSIDTSSSDAFIDNKVLEVSSREYLSQNSQISVSESSNNELESNKLKDEKPGISKSSISESGITKSGISNSGISEELQFPLSDGEGENETNEREAIESDNEDNEETDNITNNAHNGSDRETRLESSPIFIRNVNNVNNMAISLPNLWYDSVERVENVDRLSSSLVLQSEVERESDSLSNETGRVESEITGQDSDASKPNNGGEEALVDPLVELSLCKHLLYQGMGQEAAQKAFDSQKISLEKSPELLPNLIKNDKLIVKFKNQYYPYYSATPVTLEQIKQSLDLTSMICVDQITPAGGGWLWFFRSSRTVSSSTTYSVGNLGEVQGADCKNVVKIKKVRSLTPSSAELASLGLKDGCNNVVFTFSTAMLGKQQVEARIFLWKWNTRIVISDVDGTITKSDVLGQFMPLVGIDWYQTGVAHLFSAIKDNGYQVLFLSARAISQAHLTRQFLVNLKQDGKALPDGPVVISPDGLFPSLYREVIRRAPHEFKISCLEAIKAVFPADYNPFYAGFGNRDTDELSYLKVGIPLGKIFIINPKGEVAVNRRVDTKSYNSLHALVNGMFPPYSSPEQEEYNTYNFWRLPMPEIDL